MLRRPAGLMKLASWNVPTCVLLTKPAVVTVTTPSLPTV